MKNQQMRRFYLLTSGSTVLPGLGLIPTRRRALGVGILGVFVLALGVALFKVGSQGLLRTALNIGVDRGKMLVILVGILVAALIWCVTIVATAFTTRPEGLTGVDRWTMRLFTALCCVLVAFPSIFAARTIAIQRGVVDSVFSSNAPVVAGVAHPDAAKADPWAKVPRTNVLLLGSDSGADRTGIRTDSMMVASIDTHTGDAVLFGLPRNLQNVPFPTTDPLHNLYPNGYDCGSQCLLNAVWTLAEDHPDLFPGDKNPGLTATRDVIGEVLGLKINQTVIIDLRGFQQLVDAMGGVDINVKDKLCVGCHVVNGQIVGTTSYINPGFQHLNGYQALWYARSRAQSDDFSRMRRQRCVVGALLNQVNPVKMLASYGKLASVLTHNVSVDIPQQALPAWVELIQRIQKGTIKSLPVTNQVVNVSNPDFAKIRKLVQAAIHPVTTPTSTTTPTTTPSHTTKPGSTTTSTNDGLTTLAASC
jgi:LCP family protein required for cell wall assembly